MFRSFVFAALNNTVSRLTTTSAKPRPKSALSPGCGKIPKDFEFLKLPSLFFSLSNPSTLSPNDVNLFDSSMLE